jgi:hypothetical protein
MYKYAVDAGLLAKSDDPKIALLGYQALQKEVAKDSYFCALNLMWACGYHDGEEPFNYDLQDAMLRKVILMQKNLKSSDELCLAGTLCCTDPRYGWLLESGELFSFNPNSKESMKLNTALFDKSFIEGLRLLKKSADMENYEALWQMYECTRYKNPLNFDRHEKLVHAAEGLNISAMVELAEVLLKTDKSKSATLLKAASELGSIRANEILELTSGKGHSEKMVSDNI